MSEKVVIYARYSSDKQTEQSIEGQLRECHEFAKRNNYVVINEYIDRALTGTSDKRPEFLQMIEDSKKKMFNYVIVYQLDRFARNRYDSATYKAKLRKNNIRVLSARENITDDASGVLVEGMLESMAEYFSKELSQKVTRGMKESALKGNWNGGKVTYGYDIKDKKFIVNEIESKVVKGIFESVLQNKRLKDIGIELNDKGFRNKQGNKFELSFISRLVKNKKYIGKISNKYDICDQVPAIIEKDTFDQVQAKLEPHNHKPAQAKAEEAYFLSGKTYCAICKAPVTADSGTGKHGQTYKYYKCSNRKKNKYSCDKKMISKKKLENLIIETTRKDIFQDENLLNTISKNVAQSFNEQIKDNLKVKSLENQLSEVNKKIANIMLAIESGIITPTTKEKLMSYESEKFDLDEKLAITKNRAVQPISENDVKQFINSFASLDYTKIDNRKRLLEMFVNSVYLHDTYAYNGISKPRELYFANKKSYSNKKFEYDSTGAPTKIRTWDNGFEDHCDIHFTIGTYCEFYF